MSYCPALQLLQRETWGPYLESSPKITGPGLPKTWNPEKKKRTDHAVRQIIWSFSDLG